MAFQSAVNYKYTTGYAGEVIKDGPIRATTFRLNSQTTLPNVIGYAYSYSTDPAELGGQADLMLATVGGTGAFAGILVHPKHYALQGTTSGGTLAPSIILPPNVNVELMSMGIIVANFTTAVTYGDPVWYSPDVVGGDLAGGLYNSDRGTPGRKLIPNARVVSTTSAAGLAMIQLTQ